MATTELTGVPSLTRLYGKAALGAVLPGGRPGTLPDEEVALRELEIDRGHLAAYDRVCGFDLRDVLPATYLHVAAFPLAVTLMTRRDFPFPLPGLVHVANRITQYRPVTADETPTITVRSQDLRPHRKGRVLDLVATATVHGETVWEDVSTYLQRGAGRAEDAPAPGPDVAAPERSPAAAVWKVPATTGRRYAAVSGDRNPIHLSSLAARAFGFPRAIAHGMWTKARILAALQSRLPGSFTVDVRFEAPVLLPARVALTTVDHRRTVRVALHAAGSDRRHLTGEIAT